MSDVSHPTHMNMGKFHRFLQSLWMQSSQNSGWHDDVNAEEDEKVTTPPAFPPGAHLSFSAGQDKFQSRNVCIKSSREMV